MTALAETEPKEVFEKKPEPRKREKKTKAKIEAAVVNPEEAQPKARKRVLKEKVLAKDVEAVASQKVKGAKWSEEEHSQFIEAVRKHGKDWVKITEAVGTRSKDLICSHAQQFRKKAKMNPAIEGADILPILEKEMKKGKKKKDNATTERESSSRNDTSLVSEEEEFSFCD